MSGDLVRHNIKHINEEILQKEIEIEQLRGLKKEAYKACPHENASYFSEGIWNCKVWRCPDCGYEE